VTSSCVKRRVVDRFEKEVANPSQTGYGMLAIILRRKSDAFTPPGVVIVHETRAPVLVGDTPMSLMLLRHYRDGFTVSAFDRLLNKVREKKVPPADPGVFMIAGEYYFSQAGMTLEKADYEETRDRTIVIDGVSYGLKELEHVG
jgi:hypothetical protein